MKDVKIKTAQDKGGVGALLRDHLATLQFNNDDTLPVKGISKKVI